MSDVKHTAGPWSLDRDGWIISEKADFAICLIDASREVEAYDPEDAANARLIAAAPDLLEALKYAHDHLAVTHYDIDGQPDEIMQRINAALDKAEGRP